MFPMSTKGGGMSNAMPDVCKTPAPPVPSPIPIPYPNIASLSQAQGTSTKVKAAGSAVMTMSSTISMTSGDEAGVAGGVMSSKMKGDAKPKKGSAKVKAEGKAVIHATAVFSQNAMNSPAGVHGVPSQTTVMVMG